MVVTHLLVLTGMHIQVVRKIIRNMIYVCFGSYDFKPKESQRHKSYPIHPNTNVSGKGWISTNPHMCFTIGMIGPGELGEPASQGLEAMAAMCWKWRYAKVWQMIFLGDIPLHRPYIYRPYIWDWYLQSIGS